MPMDGTKDHPIIFFDDKGNGPCEHICAKGTPVNVGQVKDWLDRQIMIGGVSAEEARVLERLIEDLT